MDAQEDENYMKAYKFCRSCGFPLRKDKNELKGSEEL
jgi:hypothetical protein